MTDQIKKETTSKQDAGTKHLGKATNVVAIIFIVIQSLLFLILLISWAATSHTMDAAFITTIIYTLITLGFGIPATVIVCQRTQQEKYVSLALTICMMIFYNIVVCLLATIYSVQSYKYK